MSSELKAVQDINVDPGDELVVLSHLRWPWVWQRPQHIVSRLAASRRTWYVEEPVGVTGLTRPRIGTEEVGPLTRIWLEVPSTDSEYLYFSDPAAASYADLLLDLLGPSSGERTVWLYSPLALDLAQELDPDVLVYDVMDDLAAFAKAPEGLLLRQRRTLADADVVFTGGRSLHRGILRHRPHGTFCFPSGVEPEHYATARGLRARRPADHRPVAGYVGVIDERLDLEFVAALAADLPDWDVQMVGPIAKIDAEVLPQASNLHWLGRREYAELPAVMAGFDVALMPFALNDATRSISPTKTLEYLAAGLPVVSTLVPDVVADVGEIVHLVEGPEQAAEACRWVLSHSRDERDARAQPVLAARRWDVIVDQMEDHLARCRKRVAAVSESQQ